MPSEIYHDAEVFRAIEDACSRKPDLPQLFDIAKGYPTDPRVHSAVFVAFAGATPWFGAHGTRSDVNSRAVSSPTQKCHAIGIWYQTGVFKVRSANRAL